MSSLLVRWRCLGAALILLGACPTASATSDVLPGAEPVPGGVALVRLTTADARPTAHYRDKPVMVKRDARGWVAVVGIPLGVEPGRQTLRVADASGARRELTFEVRDKQYATQHITIKDKRKVNPNKLDLERIGREREQIRAALARWSPQLSAAFPLAAPVDGVLSSPFGLRRFFNGQPRRPHSGLDFAAPKGTVVRAAQGGEVAETGDYFFNGKTVFIDHGQGLVTMYCHLEGIDVEVGQRVARGQPIGRVGMSGRATGPHLHWGVSLNDARIDPKLVLEGSPASPPADDDTPAAGSM